MPYQQNMEGVMHLPSLLKLFDVRQVVVSTLDFVVHPGLKQERIRFNYSPDSRQIQSGLI